MCQGGLEMTVLERLKALRELMKERKIDAYLVPTDDFHASEYVGDYFKCRSISPVLRDQRERL